MPGQTIGYYTPKKEKLMREFERLIGLVNEPLASRYGVASARNLKREAREQYEKLIPSIPFIAGLRGRVLNTFLIGTAQELAVYKAMKKLGKPAGEAWEVCHRAIRIKMSETPRWKLWLLRRFMFSRIARMIVARRAGKLEKARFGDFEVEYLIGDGEDFDFGVNYLKCGNLEFAKRHGGAEFAPYICMSDIALSDAMGWGLKRTQTLADGCSHCDFRFKKGAKTRISSKTLEVQEAIEKIQTEEGLAN